MAENLNRQKYNYKRENIIWVALIPQLILITLSIIWISVSPKDNISTYLIINVKHIGIGILAGLLLAFAGYVIYKIAHKINFLKPTIDLFENILAPTFKNLKSFDVIVLSLTSGFCEEIFFRGLLQPRVGILAASIAFGLLHLPGFKYWFYAAWATLSGVILGLLFIYTGSLWVPIVAHATNNITGMFLLKKLNLKSEIQNQK